MEINIKGSPTPGYVVFEPIETFAEVATGLKDISKEGLDPNGMVVKKGDLSHWPEHDKMIHPGLRILVPKHSIQVFKADGHDKHVAIIHCTEIKFVFDEDRGNQ